MGCIRKGFTIWDDDEKKTFMSHLIPLRIALSATCCTCYLLSLLYVHCIKFSNKQYSWRGNGGVILKMEQFLVLQFVARIIQLTIICIASRTQHSCTFAHDVGPFHHWIRIKVRENRLHAQKPHSLVTKRRWNKVNEFGSVLVEVLLYLGKKKKKNEWQSKLARKSPSAWISIFG